MASSSKKNKSKKPRNTKPTQAERADHLDLYQRSVQCPEAEIDFMDSVYRRRNRRRALSMREDFCGTAFLATEWVKSHKKRRAIGVDLHEPTLDWGRKNVLAHEKKSVRDRVQLLQENVLSVMDPQVDVLCALNFSYFIFKTRALLRQYFAVARQSLAEGGLFFCELYGGTEAIVTLEEERPLDGFSYFWEQAKFNPITRETLCHIHFGFPDGSRLNKAFSYDWRLWSVPEIRELLLEAGFSDVEIHWDPVDEDGDGSGAFRPAGEEENQEGWLVYMVGVR